jgi:hypothetical protein
MALVRETNAVGDLCDAQFSGSQQMLGFFNA